MGCRPGICDRLPFFLPQRVQLSGNKGCWGIQEGMGGTGQLERSACWLPSALTSALQQAGAQTPLGGAESPALANPGAGQPLRGR